MWQMKAIRDAFGETLVELGRKNENVVVLSGDLEDSTRAEYFKKEFPKRFFNLGICEQDILGTACGMSLGGLIPFVCSFAVFGTNRGYDTLRISVCYNKSNVKIVGSHSGLTVGEDGATAQCLEDLAITRVLPNITVLSPADAIETKKATMAMLEINGPVYMRLARPPFPIITKESDPFIVGKANIIREGKDASIIACGIMVSEALKAAEMLAKENIQAKVMNMHTIKPIDEEAIVKAAKETKAVVTAEEHQINGGLGGAVAEVLGRNCPVPLQMVAVRDTFGESGAAEELLAKYHLKDKDIVSAVKSVLKKKRSASTSLSTSTRSILSERSSIDSLSFRANSRDEASRRRTTMGTKTVIEELAEFSQSIWVDNISRSMIQSGTLKKLIDAGLRGMTSNPAIFNKAITSGSDYDRDISGLCGSGKSVFEIYDDLTVKDIQDAADIFLSIYKKTQGLDGYVSLEINPKLSYDTAKTVEEGRRLYKKVNRRNVMFKVPSTKEGFPAVEELIAEGINVNITLIFSLQQYIDTANAYFRGIKHLIKNKKDVRGLHSVASVFVSRIDTAVDNLLDAKNLPQLKGKAAAANCNIIYGKYAEIFSSEDFNALKKEGVNAQRVLWGSTSTKNPAYSDIKYVTELIAKGTVNTMPENTFEAFLDHGKVKEAISADTQEARKIISTLKDTGVYIDDLCAKLLREGVVAFEKSFEGLLDAIEKKSKSVC